jgi:hypothetical protein
MNNVNRWALVAAVLLLAGIVGAAAYNAGVARGVEQSGRIVTAPAGGPYPYPYYGWYPHAGFGFLIPLAFIAFWLFVARGLFWRGGCGRRYRGSLDEWHRGAHERMWNDPPAGGPPNPGQTASR